MLQRLKKNWRELKAGIPGERFQKRYRQKQRSPAGWLHRFLFLAGGMLVMAAGLFFLPAPGPGFVILLIGAGLLAEESLAAARALDWTEIRLRRAGRWGKRLWRSHRFR